MRINLWKEQEVKGSFFFERLMTAVANFVETHVVVETTTALEFLVLDDTQP